MTILLTHSYFLKFDPKEYRAMMPYPPLGTLYAAAVVREAGHSVGLFDSMLANSEDEIEEKIIAVKPDCVVIYDDDFNYLTKMCLTRMRQAACRITQIAKKHGCIVIVHGSDPTDHFDTYFDAGVDFILIGEAERTLQELLNNLEHNSGVNAEQIPGVAYRDRNRGVVRGPQRKVLRDLDELPMPARDLVDIEHYRRLWHKHHGYFSLNIATTRGCPFHCNWCAKPLYGQIYSSHSPARIAAEVQQLQQTWAPDHIWMCDDIFGLKPGWIEEFATEIEQRNAAIPFKCLSRADLLIRNGIVEALRRAGCRTVWMGAESGAQKVLDAMDKGTTVEQIANATIQLKNAGIKVGYFLQFGYPGEQYPEIKQTIAMVRKNLPDEIGISVSYPLPKTPFYERVRSEMGDKQNWSESADLAMMFQGAFSTKFYRVLAAYVHKNHRFRLGLHGLKGAFIEPKILLSAIGRRVALLPYYLVGAWYRMVQLKLLGRQPNGNS